MNADEYVTVQNRLLYRPLNSYRKSQVPCFESDQVKAILHGMLAILVARLMRQHFGFRGGAP
jgi:hypothetical protein